MSNECANDEQIARIIHEANRVFGNTFCGDSHKSWDEAQAWERESSIAAVAFHRDNPAAPLSATHDAWMAVRVAAGWTYGIVRDNSAKTNPNLVPYDQLPKEQRFKDELQKAIVLAALPHDVQLQAEGLTSIQTASSGLPRKSASSG